MCSLQAPFYEQSISRRRRIVIITTDIVRVILNSTTDVIKHETAENHAGKRVEHI